MNHLSISHVLKDVSQLTSGTVYQDSWVVRKFLSYQIDNDITAGCTVDYFEKYGISHINLSIEKPPHQSFHFLFDRSDVSIVQGQDHLLSQGHGFLIWIPDEYKETVFLANGRIMSIHDRHLVIEQKELLFPISPEKSDRERIDLTFFVFTLNPNDFQEQIMSSSDTETRAVSRAGWFTYKGIQDIWSYLINSRFYNRSGNHPFESQQIPYSLYCYYIFLNSQTGKVIYLFLRDCVAYLTLLSLPPTNVWTHGVWLDNDIHFVHLIAGVHLFLHQYEITNQPVFLNKSRSILEYCISVSNVCGPQTRWFLHDSFEIPEHHTQTHYQKVIRCQAFGKTPENTLALNTHIATLVSLHRFYRLTSEEFFMSAYQQGLHLLYQILDAKPVSVFYALALGIRDLLLKLLVSRNKIYFPSLIRRYDAILSGWILPKLKAAWPRLYMPNGFIERDLTFSFLSQFYHLINIEQLLMLYRQEPCERLKQIITRSINYSIQSKMIVYLAYSNSLTHTFLGGLLQYGTCINPEYLKYLEEFTVFLHKKGHPMAIKIIASPYISNIYSSLKTSNPNILLLIGDALLNTVGIALNLSCKQQEFLLEIPDEKRYYLQSWNGIQYNTSDKLILDGYSSLKIVEQK